jgi:hypothetical protein
LGKHLSGRAGPFDTVQSGLLSQGSAFVKVTAQPGTRLPVPPVADPRLGEAEVAEALDDHSTVEEGEVIACDKGFADRFLEARVAGLGATLLRPDRKDERDRDGSLGAVRQWIESIVNTLKGQLSLEAYGGRPPASVMVRVAERLLALVATRWWNSQIGAHDKRSRVAYEH